MLHEVKVVLLYGFHAPQSILPLAGDSYGQPQGGPLRLYGIFTQGISQFLPRPIFRLPTTVQSRTYRMHGQPCHARQFRRVQHDAPQCLGCRDRDRLHPVVARPLYRSPHIPFRDFDMHSLQNSPEVGFTNLVFTRNLGHHRHRGQKCHTSDQARLRHSLAIAASYAGYLLRTNSKCGPSKNGFLPAFFRFATYCSWRYFGVAVVPVKLAMSGAPSQRIATH